MGRLLRPRTVPRYETELQGPNRPADPSRRRQPQGPGYDRWCRRTFSSSRRDPIRVVGGEDDQDGALEHLRVRYTSRCHAEEPRQRHEFHLGEAEGQAKGPHLEAARQLRMFLTYDEKARRRDIVDLVDVMLATGGRIGEALALVWDAVDLEVGTLEIRGTVIRIKGSGLIIKAEPKTEAGFRTLMLPRWCVARLAERRERLDHRGLRSASASGGFAGGLVFPNLVGTLRDPTNIDDMLKDAFEFAGEDMTSHKLRKTAATILDGAKLTARQIADQLGHATPSLTQDVYMGRGELSPAAAEALEALG